MMNLKTTIAAAVLATMGTTVAAENIVEIAAADERFSTLVAAVTAAGLADTLAGEGPFTVFAPVNDAFAALPEGTVETLLMEENKADLTNVLTYHVVSGKVMSTDLMAGSALVQPLFEGAPLCVTVADGVTIADSTDAVATVVIADIEADNGVIHVVDKVLLPGDAPMCN